MEIPKTLEEEEKIGILFIYEADGKEWTTYLMRILKKEPYKINCYGTLYEDLTKELAKISSVLVLILSPDMETHASSLDFNLLKPDSEHSCIVECNGRLTETSMPNWRLVYTLEETVEAQRSVLTALIDLYEGATGNKETIQPDADDVLILDVIPVVLYPGQSDVYVIFNYEEAAEITVAVEGVADRLKTRKCTKTVHVFDMPNACTGQKYVNVFVGDQKDPIFSTNILIISSENLAESLTQNLERVMFSEEQKATNVSDGLYVDPFSKTHCSDDTLRKLWQNIKLKVDETSKKTEEKPNVTRIEGAKCSVKKTDETEAERKGVTYRVFQKNGSKLDVFKNLFKKMTGKQHQINVSNRKSRRVNLAKTHRIQNFPRLPRKQ